MKVDYLTARLTVHIPISITFPEGLLQKIIDQTDGGDTKLINHYREIIKNQANMALNELPKSTHITKSNVPALIENID